MSSSNKEHDKQLSRQYDEVSKREKESKTLMVSGSIKNKTFLGTYIEDRRKEFANYYRANLDKMDFLIDDSTIPDKFNTDGLRGVYDKIVQYKKKSSRGALDKYLSIGNANTQTRALCDNPWGWRPINNSLDAKANNFEYLPKRGAANAASSHSDRPDPQREWIRLEATDWYEQNRSGYNADWKKMNCWLCGLPIWWGSEFPEGEHMLQYAFMAVFGACPMTKLTIIDDNDGKRAANVSEAGTNFSSVSSTTGPSKTPEFHKWKNCTRTCSYAWAHTYCNRVKLDKSFIKVGIIDGEIKYYLNKHAINWFATKMNEKSIIKRGNRYASQGSYESQSPGYDDYNRNVWDKLIKRCNEPGNRTRYQNWGRKIMYKNIYNQLVPLVKLLNDSFPVPYWDSDRITRKGINFSDPNDRRKTNIYFNYKRLAKVFPPIVNADNNLIKFFKNILNSVIQNDVTGFLEDSFKYKSDVSLLQVGGAGKYEEGGVLDMDDYKKVLTYNALKDFFDDVIKDNDNLNEKLEELNPMNKALIEGFNNDEGKIDDKEHEIELMTNEEELNFILEDAIPTKIQVNEDLDLNAFFDAYNSNDDTAFQPPEDCFQHPECMTVEEYEVLADHFFNYLQGKYRDELFSGEASQITTFDANGVDGKWSQEAIDRLKKIERHMFQREDGKYINTQGIRDRRLYNIFAVKCDADKMKELKLNRCIFHNHPHITEQQEWIPSRAQWKEVRTQFKDEVEEAVKKRNVTEICNTIRKYLLTRYKKKLERVSDVEIVKQVLDPAEVNLNYNKNRVKIELSRDFANYYKVETGYTNERSKWIYNNLFGPNGKVTMFNNKYYPKKKLPEGKTPPHVKKRMNDPATSGKEADDKGNTTKDNIKIAKKKAQQANNTQQANKRRKIEKQFDDNDTLQGQVMDVIDPNNVVMGEVVEEMNVDDEQKKGGGTYGKKKRKKKTRRKRRKKRKRTRRKKHKKKRSKKKRRLKKKRTRRRKSK